MAHETRIFRALDYVFRLTVGGDGSLGAYAETLFAALPASHREPRVWEVRPTDVDGAPGWELVVEGVREAATTSPPRLVHDLVRTLNTHAVSSWAGVTCHAGGVTRGGVGVVLAAGADSGKSTLTAGLVRAGFGYLTDEAVAFRTASTTIEPYPKALSLDPGSWPLFPELEPRASLGDDDYKAEQWQVPPDAIRPGATASACPARLIVFPHYVEGATTEVTPVRRAEALVELAKNTFLFDEKGRAALDELAAVVRAVDCYRLTSGDLDAAVERIETLVDRHG